MRKTIIFLISLAMMGLSGCEKGDVDPQGSQGEKGDQGISGIDGTKILSGADVPTADLGEIGDYYLRTTHSVLYGPKIKDGWGSGVSLKGSNGATGPKGADGTKILSGTATPTLSQGAVGDFYFQTATGVLYGPKTNSGWGTGMSLKGPKGDKGDTGNANVKVFEIGQRIFTTTLDVELPVALPENGAFLVYYKSYGGTTGWIPAPGYGPQIGSAYKPVYYVRMNIFEPRSGFNSGTKLSFYLDRIEDSSPYRESVRWPNLKIIFVEGNDVTKIASAGIDFNDFNQVKTALNLNN